MHRMTQYGVAGHDLIADPAWLATVWADHPGLRVTVLEDEAQHRAELLQLPRRSVRTDAGRDTRGGCSIPRT